MDDREANIDVLFRNGLKDYEVLPPGDVWEDIKPVIRKKQQPLIILRAAATVAVLISLGFLTYQWSLESRISRNISPATNTESRMTFSGTPEIEFLADASAPRRAVSNSGSPGDKIISISVAEAEKSHPEESYSSLHDNKLPKIDEKRTEPGIIAYKDVRAANVTDFNVTGKKLIELPVQEKTKRWTIGALVSPTYLSGFQTAGNDGTAQYNTMEQPEISYSGGVSFSYKIGRRLSVQSGLYYASYGNELSGISTFSGFQQYDQMKGNSNFEIKTSNGTVLTSNSDVYIIDNLSKNRTTSYFDKSSFDPASASLEYIGNSLHQNMGYLELPLIIRYKLVDRTFGFNIIGGISSNLLVNNSVYASLDGKKYHVAETEDLNHFTLSSSLGMGLEYNLGRNISLNLEPTVRYYLNPFSNVDGISPHPYSFGIFSGLSYKF